MDFKKGPLLYEGKAKKVFAVENEPNFVWLEYKDSLTAFNAQKKGSFSGKGELNRNIASFIFQYLQGQGITSHWVKDIGEREMICLRLDMIPLEVVIRNRVAGSLAKKFDLPEGRSLPSPLVEFYYKNDALNDPFVSDEQILAFQWVDSKQTLEDLKQIGLRINTALVELFGDAGIDLIDFKIEFGRSGSGEITLADEISPDSCRLWDKKSGERLDKDRFRRDLGRVEESYLEIWQRLNDLAGA